jgi:hypothetical protein
LRRGLDLRIYPGTAPKPERLKMKKMILMTLLLLTALLIATGCIPDLPGPIGIPGF